MTNQVNQAFEKWFNDEFKDLTPSAYSNNSFEIGKSNMRHGWQASTQVRESEINALKERVAELESELFVLQELRKNQATLALELTASNNQLREAAHRQRESDLAFLNKEGRKLPAVCQQKAVATVINLLKQEALADGACVKVATAVVMHGTAAISWQTRDMGLPDGVHDLYAGVRK